MGEPPFTNRSGRSGSLQHNQHSCPGLDSCRRNLVGGQHKAIRALVSQLVGVAVRCVAGGINVVNAGSGSGIQRAAGLSDRVRCPGDARDGSPGSSS